MEQNRKDKRTALLIIFGIAIVSFAFSFAIYNVISSMETPEVLSDSERFKIEYERLNEEQNQEGSSYLPLTIDSKNIIDYSDVQEVIDLMQDKTAIIFIGDPESNDCRALVPILLDSAKEVGIERIYYLNNSLIEKDEAEYQKLKDALKERNLLTSEENIYLPTVVLLKNGDTEYFQQGFPETTIEGNMTTEEKEALQKTYIEEMQNLILCDETC